MAITPIKFRGKTLSPGLGQGNTFVYRDILKQVDEFYEIESAQIDEEIKRFSDALQHISDELDSLADQVKREMDSDLGDVFAAHSEIVQDASLRSEVEQEIRDGKLSAGAAIRNVFERWEKRFRSMEAEVARQKGDDLRDLTRRLISSLAGIRGHELEQMPIGAVLVANRLLPSDTIILGRRNAAAAILEHGGAGSHAALFAHEIGLPCVAGIPGLRDRIPPDVLALVDAGSGEVIINPDPRQVETFSAKMDRQAEELQQARQHAAEPAVTKMDTSINVYANVGGADDTLAALENGAEGVGLYRIERIYLGRTEPPGTEELLKVIQETLEPARDLPVYVRLLDAGADKPLPFMEHLVETNPSLGLRGVRFLERYPELFDSQVEALLTLASDFNLHIIVPMVTIPRDMQWVRERLNVAADEAGIADVPKLGAMIETPAAAMNVKAIAEHADFLSIGTNDLTQYLFAADRENAAVDAYYDDTHDVIYRSLQMITAEANGLPVCLCGELAARLGEVERILQCGITKLSVAPPSVPRVKQAVRQVESA